MTAFLSEIPVWISDDDKTRFKLHYINHHLSEVLDKVVIFPDPKHVTTTSNFDEGLILSGELLRDTLPFCKRLTRNLSS